MYSLIWRILPGPWFVKLVLSCGLVAGAAALLWYVAFPEIAPHMPFRDSAVEVEGQGEGDSAQSEEDGGGGEGADNTGGDEGGDNTGGGGDGDTGSEEDDEGIVGVDVPVGGEDD